MKYLLIFLLIVDFKGFFGVLPPNIQLCKRNDPRISDCIVRAIQTLSPRLVRGDLGNGIHTPPLEPFLIKELNFGEDRGLQVHLSNTQIYGASNFVIQKLRFDPANIKVDILILFSKLDIKAKYKMSINFLGAHLTSDGDFYSQITGSKLKLSTRIKRHINRYGQEALIFEPFIVKFDRGTVTQLKLTNLFGGDTVLSEIVHNVMLHNKDNLLSSFYPQVESVLSRSFTEIANTVVEHATIDEAFPL